MRDIAISILNKNILEITKYEGDAKPSKKISASMFDSEPLQIYYRIKYGVLNDQNMIQENTLGSLTQKGLDELADLEDFYEAKVRREIKYKDWIISAETDLIDLENKAIVDFKVTKEYTYKKFNQNHQYAWQVRLQDYIFRKTNTIDNDYDLYVYMFLKDVRQDTRGIKPINAVIQVNRVDDEEIEAKLDGIIELIDSWLEDESLLTQCSQLWFRKDKDGNSYPSRCEKYCSYKKVCKFYKENNSFNAQINKLSWD